MSSADSPGRSTLKDKAILIFDLDGTILSVNSFPYWARYMLSGHFGGLSIAERLALSLRTGQILMERKLLRRDHYSTKRKLQALWTHAVDKDSDHVATQGLNSLLQKHVRPNMRSVIAAVAGRHVDALLATSAAGEYAYGLSKTLGFTHVLTTPLCTEAGSKENCKERKRDRVLTWLWASGWFNRPRIFFTDHEEDLPLIRECSRTLWFGRDEDAAAMRELAPRTEIIACRNLSDADVMQLVTLEQPTSSGKSTTNQRYG